MKSYKENRIKEERTKKGIMFEAVYTSKELPTRKDRYSVVLKPKYGKGGVKRFKNFDPTDEKSINEFEEQVLIWNKRILTK